MHIFFGIQFLQIKNLQYSANRVWAEFLLAFLFQEAEFLQSLQPFGMCLWHVHCIPAITNMFVLAKTFQRLLQGTVPYC